MPLTGPQVGTVCTSPMVFPAKLRPKALIVDWGVGGRVSWKYTLGTDAQGTHSHTEILH